ncbi:hypothetical protein C8J55DRAFT_565906 [Lentinula edodes]|uniref:Uncharacterized protein n=1 Tax=Lentinula lateritia TaxID=40482 RepID=A0A9W8ZTU2_9AGAR|nr:hypothetical protein C8J55DRAFT_565906 [Lentinula edodes]
MSDDQFRHVISQLPLSGRTATTTRATRGSSSSTPQPPPMLMLEPPSYVPQYPQGQQPPQTQTQTQNQMQQTQTQNQTQYQHYQIPQPQPTVVAPVAPVVGTPISSSAQAYFTSYASRLRTGATLLVQPTLFPGSTTTTASFSLPIPSTSLSSTLATTTHPTRASRRSRGTVINYAEVDNEGDDDEGEGEGDDAKKDGDHIPDAGALDDDATDGDFVAGNGRRVGRPSKQQQQQGRGDTSMDLDQSYLGQVPPARFIKSRGFLSNAATAQGGPMRDVVDWGVLGAHPPLNSNSNSIPGSVGDSEGTVKDRTGLGLGSLGCPSRERDGRYPKPLRSAWRDWAEAEEYATRWEVLSPKEVERREVERERAGRRLRRETTTPVGLYHFVAPFFDILPNLLISRLMLNLCTYSEPGNTTISQGQQTRVSSLNFASNQMLGNIGAPLDGGSFNEEEEEEEEERVEIGAIGGQHDRSGEPER